MDWAGRIEQAADVMEARAKTFELQPDILLLDILMPVGSGFDVLEQLGPEPGQSHLNSLDQAKQIVIIPTGTLALDFDSNLSGSFVLE